jgi:hypothetical protein
MNKQMRFGTEKNWGCPPWGWFFRFIWEKTKWPEHGSENVSHFVAKKTKDRACAALGARTPILMYYYLFLLTFSIVCSEEELVPTKDDGPFWKFFFYNNCQQFLNTNISPTHSCLKREICVWYEQSFLWAVIIFWTPFRIKYELE